MDFEWSSAKAKANLLQHRVDFADAATSFHDDRALTIADPDSEREERFRIPDSRWSQWMPMGGFSSHHLRTGRTRSESSLQERLHAANVAATTNLYEKGIRLFEGKAWPGCPWPDWKNTNHHPAR
jgi:hypothetical protein